VDNDGNSATASNDDDLDWLVELVPAIAPANILVDSTTVRPVCVGTKAYSGDGSKDDDGLGYANMAIEKDACIFANAHD
jgi:hypothetical protein